MDSPASIEPTLISVILLCFNHERYIDEALDGLFAQTYSRLDIIIVDDCSSDRTADIIDARLARRGDRSNVRFVRNQRNMVHPIPAVIGMAAGSFIVIACGDDVMLPTMLERMARAWKDEKVSLVTANALYIDDQSNDLNRTYRDPNVPADATFETLARYGTNVCCFGAAMGFDRAIYDNFGWPPTQLLGASDIVLPFYAYLLNGARFVTEPLLKYRVHARNTSLSLLAEKSAGEDLLLAIERSYNNHLAHAVFFARELDWLRHETPARFADVANRMLPVVEGQRKMLSKALVRTRHELDKLRRTQSGEPDAPASDLPTMTVTEIAEYLRDHSTFGMRQSAKLNFKELVERAIAWELRRAGRDKDIRFVASRAGTDRVEEIDPSFWRLARFADDSLWDRRNAAFTEPLHYSTSPPPGYRHGRAPRVDVMRTWPRATVFRKAWTRLQLIIKFRWYLLLGKARHVVLRISDYKSPRG
jgi:glycosyltransferase involved in cell wall biosynthesis